MNHLFHFALFLALSLSAFAVEPFRIEIVEKGSGWPVSLVELRAVHQQRFVSDNAGLIAMDAPELMGREVWFDVHGHGYEVPKDGFGYRGIRLNPKPGETTKVEVTRTILAKRLGRLTGAGLFAEAQKLGLLKDWKESGLLGCDSVQNAVYGGKLYWAWGDTLLPNYPLGIYDMIGAVTPLQPLRTFEPPLKLQFEYFRDEKAQPRGIAKMPGSGPTWFTGLTTLKDKNGKEHMVAAYVKIKPPLEAYEAGLCVWNDHTKAFDRSLVYWSKSPDSPKQPLMPDGQPFMHKDADGTEWVYFGNPLPVLKCKATFEAWSDPKQWGVLEKQEKLISAGDGKQQVKPHSGSVAWNAYRKKWVTIFVEFFGKPSVFGEVWYAEADAPAGPWGPAVKVLSHDNYTFYNPRIHPEFTDSTSPILIFEGTYTSDFADKPIPTPRYNYNQMLYRLDLDDPALLKAVVRRNSSDK